MWFRKLYRFVQCSQILQRSVICHISHITHKSPNSTQYLRVISRRLFPSTPFIFVGMWGFIKPKSEKESVITTKEVLIAKADAMYDQGHYKEIYDLLSHYKDSKDVEILWRLCRALYKMSKAASDVEGRKMIIEAYHLISIALKVQEDHFAVHKWMAILLDSKSSFEGMKSRIQQLHNVKQHLIRAIELNPGDATSLYMLGSWCFQISDLAWYQRKIATIIFGEPPVSSYEEALKYFETAEKVDPKFYSHNLLMLGKTYLKLGRKQDAVKYLTLASEFPAKNDEDHEAKQEALKLLEAI